MPRNRIEELALGYQSGHLSTDEEQELLKLLEDPQNCEYLANNLLVNQLLKAVNPSAESRTRVLRLISDTQDDFSETILEQINYEESKPLPEFFTLSDFSEEEIDRTKAPSTPPKRKSTTPWSGIIALAACLAILWSYTIFFPEELNAPQQTVAQIEPIATMATIQGKVMLLRKGKMTELREGSPIFAQDIIKTEEASLATFFYREEADKTTSITLTPRTQLTLQDHSKGKIILLNQGKLKADVAPQKEPMTLITPHAIATVLGTRFSLTTGNETTRLRVSEGKVKLEPLDHSNSTLVTEDLYGLVGISNRGANFIRLGRFLDKNNPLPYIDHFTFIASESQRPIEHLSSITHGASISLSEIKTQSFGIQANVVNGSDGSVYYALYKEEEGIQNKKPHKSITVGELDEGKISHSYTAVDQPKGSAWNLEPGYYTLTATPYSGANTSGKRGEAHSISFQVTE